MLDILEKCVKQGVYLGNYQVEDLFPGGLSPGVKRALGAGTKEALLQQVNRESGVWKKFVTGPVSLVCSFDS